MRDKPLRLVCPRPEFSLNPERKAALPLLTVEARVTPKMAIVGERYVIQGTEGLSFFVTGNRTPGNTDALCTRW